MSPNVEPVVAQGNRYTLRHIGPRAAVWPTSPNPDITVLNRTDMVARPLPSSSLPSSPDFVSGTWNGRLGDAGDGMLLFPNTIASDGVAYRERFDPEGHCQFIEIYNNGNLDFVGVIDQVIVDQQQVQVHLSDGWFLLKKAYERDWIVTQSPRDVIERVTKVWVPTIVDDFPAGSLNSQWTNESSAGGTATIGPTGGLRLATAATASSTAYIQSSTITLGAESATWAASCSILCSPEEINSFTFAIEEAGSIDYYVGVVDSTAIVSVDAQQVGEATITGSQTYSFRLESDGEWIWGFVNGQFIGGSRRPNAGSATLATHLVLGNGSGTTAQSATVYSVLLESLQPFLQPGTDDGDYLLPGAWDARRL